MTFKRKLPKEGKSLADRGIFVRKVESPNRPDEHISMHLFFADIWEEREHKCFETDVPLPAGPFLTYFHHILPKAKYPQYRYEKWNIVLLHPDSHSQVETFIDKCPRVKALTEHLKIVYG